MSKFLLIFFFVTSSLFCKEKHDRYIDTILQKCRNDELDIAFKYCDSLLALGTDSSKYESYVYRGFVYYQKQQFDSTISLYLYAYPWIIKNASQREISFFNWSIGKTYMGLKQYESSIPFIQKALEYEHPQKTEFSLLNNIGLCYFYIDDRKKARFYFTKAERIANELDDPSKKEICLTNIALIDLEEGDFKTSTAKLKQALEISLNNNDTLSMINSYENLALQFLQSGKFDQAIKHYTEAIQLSEAINDVESINYILNNMLITLNENNKNSEAIDLFNEKFVKIENIHSNRLYADIYYNLTLIALELKDYKLLSEYMNEYNRIQQLQYNYILEEKSKIDKALATKGVEISYWITRYNESKNIFTDVSPLFLSFIALLASIIIIYFLWKFFKNRRKRENKFEPIFYELENGRYDHSYKHNLFELEQAIQEKNIENINSVFQKLTDTYHRSKNQKDAQS